MKIRFFRSRCFIYSAIFVFICLLISDVFPDVSDINQDEFVRLIKEGKSYYEKGEYERAIIVFFEAEKLISNRVEQIEFYFNLSLAYYALGQNEKVKENFQKLFSIQSYYSIDERNYPSGFIALFNQIQREAFFFITDKDKVEVEEGRKASIRVKLSAKPSSEIKATVDRISGDIDIGVQSGSQLVFTPDNWNAYQAVVLEAEVDQDSNDDQATIRITAQGIPEKEILVLEQDMLTTKNGKKKGKSALFIVAGLAAAGGIVAALLLGKKENGPKTGSIQVTSTPTGARVFLDGIDTGQVTNCTLTNISPGSHMIRLVREGYVDTERSVSVTARQTTTVNINLAAHTVTVTEPSGSSSWTKGEQVTIRWTPQGSLNSHTNIEINLGSSRGINTIKTQFYRSIKSQLNSLPHKEKKQRNKLESENDRVIQNKKNRVEEIFDKYNSLRNRRNILVGEKDGERRIDAKLIIEIKSSQTLNKKAILRMKPLRDGKIQSLNKVKIDLYRGDDLVRTIANNISNSGSFQWRVESSIPDDAKYRIRISCAEDSDVFGESEDFIIKTRYVFDKKWGSQGSGNYQFEWAVGICVDNLGNVYIADDGNYRIMKFTSSGNFITKWGTRGGGNYQFDGPRGIAKDSAGNIYVADGGRNHRIIKFTSNGNYITKWGSEGSGNYQFEYPEGISVDSSGNVYVADFNNNRIMKFTSNGNYITKWGDQGGINLGGPDDVSVDNSGNVYVIGGNRIMKFTSNGNYITEWGTQGSGDNNLYRPMGVAVDSSGYVYVADTWNHRVMIFTSNGEFINKWGSKGRGNYQFRKPGSIAIDSTGNVYITDTYNYRIMKFRPSVGTHQDANNTKSTVKTGIHIFTPLQARK